MNILPDIDKSTFHSVIVFSERCELKKVNLTSDNHIVLKRNYLMRSFVGKIETKVFSDNEIDSIYQKLNHFTQTTEAVKMVHINNIAKEHSQ